MVLAFVFLPPIKGTYLSAALILQEGTLFRNPR